MTTTAQHEEQATQHPAAPEFESHWSATASMIAIGMFTAAVNGLSHMAQFRDGPLGDWYVQAGIVVAALLAYEGLSWLWRARHRA